MTRADIEAFAADLVESAKRKREHIKERRARDIRVWFRDESTLSDAEETAIAASAATLDDVARRLRLELAKSVAP